MALVLTDFAAYGGAPQQSKRVDSSLLQGIYPHAVKAREYWAIEHKGVPPMTKSQFLLEARSHAKPKTYSGRSAVIRATTFLENGGFKNDVDEMTGEEQLMFAKQVRQSLNRERRRSAARAGTYDITRHIALYLADKALRNAGI